LILLFLPVYDNNLLIFKKIFFSNVLCKNKALFFNKYFFSLSLGITYKLPTNRIYLILLVYFFIETISKAVI